MTRVFRICLATVVYFCVGTVIAEAILVAYVAVAWQIDRDRLVQMAAVARGIDLAAVKQSLQRAAEAPTAEQPSYDQILEARAVKVRHLELREQALRSAVDQLRVDQTKLTDDQKSLRQLRDSFAKELVAAERRAQESGVEEARGLLSTIKPKQAKELLLQMLEKNEIGDVVLLLSAMPESRRAKIIGEFKSPDETKKIDEVLRLIRRGELTASVSARAQQQLGGAAPARTQGTP
jgi:hypothetical protein